MAAGRGPRHARSRWVAAHQRADDQLAAVGDGPVSNEGVRGWPDWTTFSRHCRSTTSPSQLGVDPSEATARSRAGRCDHPERPAAQRPDSEGAAAIEKALGKHGGEVAGGTVDLKALDTADGQKILGHIFGGQEDAVAAKLTDEPKTAGSTSASSCRSSRRSSWASSPTSRRARRPRRTRRLRAVDSATSSVVFSAAVRRVGSGSGGSASPGGIDIGGLLGGLLGGNK